jgi:hypothetical protein
MAIALDQGPVAQGDQKFEAVLHGLRSTTGSGEVAKAWLLANVTADSSLPAGLIAPTSASTQALGQYTYVIYRCVLAVDGGTISTAKAESTVRDALANGNFPNARLVSLSALG